MCIVREARKFPPAIIIENIDESVQFFRKNKQCRLISINLLLSQEQNLSQNCLKY